MQSTPNDNAMVNFLNKLRHALNHLTGDNHVEFHKQILEAGRKAFNGTNDFYVEDWLDTENSYTSLFDKTTDKTDKEDIRCDADRTLMCCLANLVKTKSMPDQLESFRKIIEPQLPTLPQTPAFSINSLSSMPWDGTNVLHQVLSNQMTMVSPMLKRTKTIDKTMLDNYILTARDMNSSYWNFGGEYFRKDLDTCNDRLSQIYNYISSYLTKARSKTSERYTTSVDFISHIDNIIAFM